MLLQLLLLLLLHLLPLLLHLLQLLHLLLLSQGLIAPAARQWIECAGKRLRNSWRVPLAGAGTWTPRLESLEGCGGVWWGGVGSDGTE